MAAKISKKQLGEKLIQKLDLVFANNKTKDYFIKDGEFQRLIGKQILILSSLGFKEEADRYVALGKEATKAFEPPKYIAPDNIDDDVDEVNFLDVFIQNTFKKTLEQMRDDEIEAAKNPKPSQSNRQAGGPNQQMDPQQQQQQGGFFRQNQNGFFANPFMPQNPNMPPHPLQDPNFYPYASKPKYMPLLRNAIGVLFLLLALVQILICIAQAMNKNTIIGFYTNTSGVSQAVYYPYTNALIIPILVACVLSYLGYQYLRPTRYDRVKYRINASGAIMFVVIFCGLQLISDFWINGDVANVLTHRSDWLSINSADAATNINMLFATKISFYALGGFIIVVTAFIQYLNPPVDQEKIMTASQEWMDNIGNPNQGEDQA